MFWGRVENRKIAKMTEMLLAGGKMLSIHCATCMGTLFEFEGRIICPVCEGRTKPVKEKAKLAPPNKIEKVLRTKLDSLAEQLEKETDHSKTLEMLDRVKSILEVLERLRKG